MRNFSELFSGAAHEMEHPGIITLLVFSDQFGGNNIQCPGFLESDFCRGFCAFPLFGIPRYPPFLFLLIRFLYYLAGELIWT
jgi:hypothetical protein